MHFKGKLKGVWGNPFQKRVEEGILFWKDALKRVLTKSFEKCLESIKTFYNVLKAFKNPLQKHFKNAFPKSVST